MFNSATALVRQRTRSLFFGWWIVCGGIGIQTLANALLYQTYGAYIVLLQEQFGWSKTSFSVAYALQRAESGMLGPVQGWLLDRFGPRAVMRAGTILFGAGFILFSQIESLTMFYLAFLIMAIGSSFGGFMTIATTVMNWFERKRSTAMGIVQIGMGIGGFTVPVVAWALESYGWRPTAFVSGILIIVVGLPVAQLMRQRPEAYGMLPDGAKPDALSERSDGPAPVVSLERVEFTARQAMRTPVFWYLSLGHTLALLVVSAVTVHLVAHLTEGLGYTLGQAALVVALVTASALVGNLVGGLLGDRFSKRLITTVAMLGHTVALLILAMAQSLAPVLLFAVLQGMAHGTRGVLMQPIRADYFGRQAFGMVMGISSLVIMWGQMAGPIVAGAMADRLGNYELSFVVLALCSALGTIFFAISKKPELSTAPRQQPAGSSR